MEAWSSAKSEAKRQFTACQRQNKNSLELGARDLRTSSTRKIEAEVPPGVLVVTEPAGLRGAGVEKEE